MSNHTMGLKWLLRVVGAMEMTAVFFIFVPFAWMQAIHEMLGMGPLPDLPAIQYLARSLSSFYAFHGLVFIFFSLDIGRYLPIIRLSAWALVAFGAFMLALDLILGLPLAWTLSEGPFLLVVGAAMLHLIARIDRPASSVAQE